MRVDIVFEGVSRLPPIDHPLWVRWKVGRNTGETTQAVPKGNMVVWSERVSFKTTLKRDSKGLAFDKKYFVIRLQGKKGRNSFTLGTVTIDLASYVGQDIVTLGEAFEPGPLEGAELRMKVRVASVDDKTATEPLDVSSTMGETEDGDDGTNKDDVEGSPFVMKTGGTRFVRTAEELNKGRGARAPGVVSEEELREMRRRAAHEKRDMEAKHQMELSALHQQIRVMQADHEARLQQVKEELQKTKEANSAGALLAMRAQLEEAQDQVTARSQTIQMLRDQLTQVQARLVDQTAACARAEASLQRAEKEVQALRSSVRRPESRAGDPDALLALQQHQQAQQLLLQPQQQQQHQGSVLSGSSMDGGMPTLASSQSNISGSSQSVQGVMGGGGGGGSSSSNNNNSSSGNGSNNSNSSSNGNVDPNNRSRSGSRTDLSRGKSGSLHNRSTSSSSRGGSDKKNGGGTADLSALAQRRAQYKTLSSIDSVGVLDDGGGSSAMFRTVAIIMLFASVGFFIFKKFLR